MNVDKFGHHVFKRQKVNRSLESPMASLLDGPKDFIDFKNKIIRHIGKPINPEDGATKKYIDDAMQDMSKAIKSISQNLQQLDIEINSIKQSINAVAQKSKYKK